MEFSLKEIIEIIIKRIVLILLSVLFGAILFFLYSKYLIKPTYIVSTKMYVSANISEETVNSAKDLNELNYAQKIVNTYINLLQTNIFYHKVLQKSGLDYTQGELKNMTSVVLVNDTEIFKVSVVSTNARDAYILVRTMEDVAPELISEINKTAKLNIVDPAVEAVAPTSPNVLKNTVLGAMIALLLSCIASFLLEILDNKVKGVEDIENKYKIPIIGEIPVYQNSNKLIDDNLQRSKMANYNAKGIFEDSRFIVNEAYKTCRSNLNFTLRYGGCKRILVNSPTPQDGKSTTAVNLAMSIAQTDAKVIILDCDLRKGKINNLLHIKSNPGMSELLSGQSDLQSVVVKTDYDNLFAIPIGTIPPNPSELLSGTLMEQILTKLGNDYEYVIIDSPPVKLVSDALNLIKMVDGILFVVRQGYTTHINIGDVISKYELHDANVLGFVVNGISINKEIKNKYHNYY